MAFKFLFIFLAFVLSQHARASQARINALQSNHLLDTEFIYLFPTKLLELPDYIIFQSGSTLDSNYYKRPYVALKNTHVEDQADQTAIAFTLGRQSDLVDGARQKTNTVMTSAFERTSNPIEITYAVRNLGTSYSLGFFYAAQNDKLHRTGNQASTMNLGVRMDDFTFSTTIGLYNYVDDFATNSHLSINQSFMGALVYEMDDIHFFLDLSSSRSKKSISSNESDNIELLNYKMGLVKNTFNGQEIIFYRINLETDHIKNRTLMTNDREIKLPLTLGYETVLNDEMMLRGSIKQIVGVYQSDDFTAGSNTTTAAVGLGFKLNKLTLDGTLQGLIGSNANQKIDAEQLLTETSLTYWF